MKLTNAFLFKAALLALVLLLLQIVFAPRVNLLFTAILVFASLLGFYETLFMAVIAASLSVALLYHSNYPWLYIVFAVLATKLNPKQIPDKFIVSLLYAIFFTAIYECFNPNSSAYFDRLLITLPSAALAATLMHFGVLLVFKDSLPQRKKKF